MWPKVDLFGTAGCGLEEEVEEEEKTKASFEVCMANYSSHKIDNSDEDEVVGDFEYGGW